MRRIPLHRFLSMIQFLFMYSVTFIESFILDVKEFNNPEEDEEVVEPKEEKEERKIVYSKLAFDDPNEGMDNYSGREGT